MIDLMDKAFLEVFLLRDRLEFGGRLEPVEPAVRLLEDARYAFQANDAVGPRELYYMYRDVARSEDRGTLSRHGLRFDITVILPGLIGQEYNKTVGHYHPIKTGTLCTYPEVYEVLYGEATYLLQRPSEQERTVDDVVVIVARPGNKVVIPPGYGHITINAGKVPLVMNNWVAAEFASVYGDIKELRGGAYYLVNKDGVPDWTPNPLYSNIPALRFVPSKDYPEFGLSSDQPMYKLITQSPDKLRFLTHPEEHSW